MCGCTELGHDDVRRLIVARELKSIPQVMQELEWKTSCGCAKCRPALNYYLLCDWPTEYEDDSQSRITLRLPESVKVRAEEAATSIGPDTASW